ncbi:MAG: hypothetical protein A2049_01785 [Elusimicrobia bacterium GWA2_62_23]|nr:MAG: hypothetical protein A2049_01785 [Elusimicrobia bacterium GWA2_62_23]
MENINFLGEYALRLSSIDGSRCLCHLIRSKFSLFTLGRGGAESKHLSVKLVPDDPDSMGLHFLSSMQCYFAWDPGIKDWVVGNGKPPEKYIPPEKAEIYSEASSGPSSEANMIHLCYNRTEDCSPSSSRFVPWGARPSAAFPDSKGPAPEPLRGILGVAFIKSANVRYKGCKVPPHYPESPGIKGPVPYAFLLEVLQPSMLDSLPGSNKRAR